MTKYTFEGTITAITCKDGTLELKLAGLEGYAIKLGDKKYNVLCSEGLIENSKVKEDKDNTNDSFNDKAIVLSQNYQFTMSDDTKTLLTTSGLGKKVKATVECEANKQLKITSITIFAD